MIWDLHVAPQFFGCTVSADGRKGLVPKPVAGEHLSFLRGDGTWQSVSGAGLGDVSGPASSTTNAVALFSSATGKNLKNSGVLIDASNNVTGVGSIRAATGYTDTAGTTGFLFSGATNQFYCGGVNVFSITATAVATTVSLTIAGAGTDALTVGNGTDDRRIFAKAANPYAIGVQRGTIGGKFWIGAANDAASPNLQFSNNAGTEVATLTETGNFSIGGNLTVSGTGTSSFAGPVQATRFIATSTSTFSGALANLGIYNTQAAGNVTLQSNGGSVRISRYADDVTLWTVADASGNATLLGNLTASGTGTHTFAGVVRGTQMYGLCAAAGTSGYFTDATNSTLYITHPSAGVMSFKNGSGTTWLSETSTNVTLAGNLSASGTGTHTFGGPVSLNIASGDLQYNLLRSSVNKGIIGVPGTAGNIVADSAADDMVMRTTSGKEFRVTTDGGSTSALRIATTAATFAGTVTTAAPTGGAGAWKLGIANAVSPTAPNRTVTIEVGGTLYYLHAKTTND